MAGCVDFGIFDEVRHVLVSPHCISLQVQMLPPGESIISFSYLKGHTIEGHMVKSFLASDVNRSTGQHIAIYHIFKEHDH